MEMEPRGFPEWMSVSTRLVGAVERGEWGEGR